jgi:hypothetical protein
LGRRQRDHKKTPVKQVKAKGLFCGESDCSVKAPPRVGNFPPTSGRGFPHPESAFTYQGVTMQIEVKSIQTNSVKRLSGSTFQGIFQCDASDRRLVRLPNGESVQTTCLLVGEFDLVAVSLFQFLGEWVFAFAKNADLPRASNRYPETIRPYLLASYRLQITWPLQAPFQADPFPLLAEIVLSRGASGS